MSGITLLVPCHNAGRYLGRLLESVRAQTSPFARILCYDDASTDDTLSVAAGLGLEILRGETNRGPAFARNRLADAARTEWVHYHDADDLLLPGFVERMSGLLSPAVDVAVCNMDWVTESTRGLEVAWRYNGESLAFDPVEANLTNPVGVIACVFRLEALRRVGGFDESLRTWEDADLQVRLSLAGARYRAVPEVLAIGLRNNSGASSNANQMTECQVRLLEGYADSLPARYRDTVAAQSEKLAAWLLVEHRHPNVVTRCLKLCRRLGWQVPSSSDPLLHAARAVLPARWALHLQTLHRRRCARRDKAG
jgi:glycosyltransferase involved in cell wall biosynthesis